MALRRARSEGAMGVACCLQQYPVGSRLAPGAGSRAGATAEGTGTHAWGHQRLEASPSFLTPHHACSGEVAPGPLQMTGFVGFSSALAMVNDKKLFFLSNQIPFSFLFSSGAVSFWHVQQQLTEAGPGRRGCLPHTLGPHTPCGEHTAPALTYPVAGISCSWTVNHVPSRG